MLPGDGFLQGDAAQYAAFWVACSNPGKNVVFLQHVSVDLLY